MNWNDFFIATSFFINGVQLFVMFSVMAQTSKIHQEQKSHRKFFKAFHEKHLAITRHPKG